MRRLGPAFSEIPMSDSYTGAKWGDAGFGTTGGTVSWSFAHHPGALYSYDAAIDGAALQNLVRAAFEVWESVADIDFREVASDAADVLLGWDAFDGAGGTLAETSWQYVEEITQHSEIAFDPAETWSTGGGAPGFDFLAAAVHEIGHAIGLSHTDSAASVMYPQLHGAFASLPSADVATIQALYGASPLALGAPIIFNGTIGSDMVSGQSADDVLAGDAGNDVIHGGDGDDILYGNEGDDRLYGDGGHDCLYGGQDHDELYAGAGDDVVYGNRADDVLYGGAGQDRLYGNQDADTLFGNQDADALYGGQGDDTLYGGQGNDVLNGGAGNDRLAGNKGADRFVFHPGQGTDTVADFSFEEGDRLDLQGQDYAVSAGAGNDVQLLLAGGGTIILEGVGADDFDPNWLV